MKIETRNLVYIYLEGSPLETLAIENIDIKIEKHQVVAILGKSGSGKSTLIQHFNGLLNPTAGKVLVDDKNIDEYNDINIAHKIGLVFQFPEIQLFEETVYDDIAFGPRNLGWDENEINNSVLWAVNNFSPEIKDKFDKSPFELSGGEMRKVAICGILAMKPDVLCFDEPTAGLDPKSKNEFYSLIMRLHKKGLQVVFITHDIEDALEYADRIIIMENGKIAEDFQKVELKKNMEILLKYDFDLPQYYKISKYLSENIDFPKCYNEKQLLKNIDNKV